MRSHLLLNSAMGAIANSLSPSCKRSHLLLNSAMGAIAHSL
ncbi:MAG: hypothetical protein V7K46_08855 [Nostoc sp.]